MMDRMKVDEDLRQALVCDEIGIETALYRDYRLNSAFQLIYRHDDASLIPCMSDAAAAPFIGRRRLDFVQFLSDAGNEQRTYLSTLLTTLHLRNFWHIGVDEPGDFRLFLPVDPLHGGHRDVERAAAEIAEICDHAEAPRENVVCHVNTHGVADRRTCHAFARALAEHDLGVSIGAHRGSAPDLDGAAQIRPEFVRIDVASLRSVGRGGARARLFSAGLHSLRELGCSLLVCGIETPDDLDLALKAGAGHLQGGLLGAQKLAGVILEERPLSVASLLGGFGRTEKSAAGR